MSNLNHETVLDLGSRDKKGRFLKGYHYNKQTEFKKGCHWRSYKSYWDKDWLYTEYIIKKRSAADISKDFDCNDSNILYFLKKHKILTRIVSEAREVKHWGSSGKDNPMWGKNGKDNPNWKGGISQERQLFYESRQWKKVCSDVWTRDNATCQRCGLYQNDTDVQFHIHHKISFSYEETRAKLLNLVLLCKVCHYFVHSSLNTEKEFLENVGV